MTLDNNQNLGGFIYASTKIEVRIHNSTFSGGVASLGGAIQITSKITETFHIVRG